MAVAGGVNVITSPALFQNLAAASFLSPTGASKAFDAGANGYCRGEGAGLVVLKPLARALADGDPVLAVISGSAVNQGSNCSPITVPVSESQSALYKKALSVSRVHPDEVSFVEAHGTGQSRLLLQSLLQLCSRCRFYMKKVQADIVHSTKELPWAIPSSSRAFEVPLEARFVRTNCLSVR
jgi:hypothetical protein